MQFLGKSMKNLEHNEKTEHKVSVQVYAHMRIDITYYCMKLLWCLLINTFHSGGRNCPCLPRSVNLIQSKLPERQTETSSLRHHRLCDLVWIPNEAGQSWFRPFIEMQKAFWSACVWSETLWSYNSALHRWMLFPVAVVLSGVSSLCLWWLSPRWFQASSGPLCSKRFFHKLWHLMEVLFLNVINNRTRVKQKEDNH